MSKLTTTTFVTLDGVMQAPGGPEEDRTGAFGHGGWLVPYADADMGTGKRLFGAGAVPAALTLASTQTTGKGVLISTYLRAGRPSYGSFAIDG
jgi:hypothetical protein